MERWTGALLTLSLLAFSACGGAGGDGADGTGTDQDQAPPGEPGAPGTPGANPGEAAQQPVCLSGGPFTAEGEVEVEGEGADAAVEGVAAEGSTEEGTAAEGPAPEPPPAERLAALRWERHDGCERVVLDLSGPEETPAGRAGEVTAEVLRDLGVVRIGLRDVEWVDTAATDAAFEGPLAGGAYAFFSPDGRWVDVDVHLAGAAEAALIVLEDPARVVVDLRPGGGPVPEPAPRENRVVVLEPRPGPASYPLTVRGYARTFEANVVVRLEREGEEVYDDFTTATAWADAWGHYSFTIPEGPSGNVTLHVGEHSARDGTWEGVAVPLEMR